MVTRKTPNNSTTEHGFLSVWNHETIIALRKNVSRFIRTDSNGDNVYLTIKLAIPTSDSGIGHDHKSRIASNEVLTDSGYVPVSQLAQTAKIAFDLTIESVGTSKFDNHTLQVANGVQREKRSTMTIYVESDENGVITAIDGFMPHLDYNPAMLTDNGNLAYVVSSHMKFAKADKARQQWAKRNGEYVDKR